MNNLDLLYKNKLIETDSNNYVNSSDEESSEEESENDKKIITQTQFLVVSSFDRNLIKNPSTFTYSVKFTPVPSGIEEVTIGGVTSKVNFVGQQDDAFILTLLKNVISVELLELTIPNLPVNILDRCVIRRVTEDTRLLGTRDTPRYSYFKTIKDYPYLLVNIDQIDGNIQITNDTVSNVLGIMKLKTPPIDIIEQGIDKRSNELGETIEVNSRKMLHYENIKGSKKIFYPTPKNSINMLNINILDNRGNPITLITDVMNIGATQIQVIESASAGVFHPYRIKLTSHTYFSLYEWQAGDTIIIKDFSWGDRNASIFDQNKLAAYINRTSGHSITEVAEDVFGYTGITNTIYINFPWKFHMRFGELLPDTDYLIDGNGLTDIPDDSPTSNDGLYEPYGLGTGLEGGKIINASLQNTLTFKVESLIYDSSDIHNTELV